MTEPSLRLRVQSLAYGAEQIVVFDLRRPGGGTLPSFAPGAHINVKTGPGLVRSYSLLNDGVAPERYLIAVQRDRRSRGGSSWLHEKLRPGDLLEVSAPTNRFPLEESATHSRFVAGGIGITPILGMVRRLEQLGHSWMLYYRFRARDAAFIPDELEAWRAAGKVHFSDAAREGRQAFDVREIVEGAEPDAHLYCCGPGSMMEAFAVAASQRPPSHVHMEHFQTGQGGSTDGGFVVNLVRSGRTITMAPGKSILAAVRELGIEVDYSCEQGLCGECETRVIAGTPDHRDLYLTQAEKLSGTKIMICCSGSLSPELDLDL